MFTFVVLLSYSTPANACSVVGSRPVAIDSDLADGVGPEVADFELDIHRGRGPRTGALGCSTTTSCDDLGSLSLGAIISSGSIEPVGYRLEVLGGVLPDDLYIDEEYVLAPGSGITIHWIDGATDDQESIDFTLRVIPVDEGGDEGAPVDVDIFDPGSVSMACQTAPSPLRVGILALAIPWGWMRRRRRQPA